MKDWCGEGDLAFMHLLVDLLVDLLLVDEGWVAEEYVVGLVHLREEGSDSVEHLTIIYIYQINTF